MIEILGVTSGQEYEAAVHLRKKMLALWPDLNQSKTDNIKMFVGLKMYGLRVEDIDIVVLAHLGKERDFDIELPFAQKGKEAFVPRKADIKNFALVIEVKSHDPSGVKFQDKVASVRYRKGDTFVWDDVTEKNRIQMFEFKKYIENHGADSIYVQNLIFFTGLKETDLPERPHNCFGFDASFERVLNMLGQVSGAWKSSRDASISFGNDAAFSKILSPSFPLLQNLEPTVLDRRRMDRIARSFPPDAWLEDLGKRQVMIKGRGGVGKTVALLQMSFSAFDKMQRRSLLLTYNRALVADMRRTMALMGIPKSIEMGGISIETVHSFIGKLLLGVGVIKDYDSFLESYEKNKDSLLEYLNGGAISTEELEALFTNKASDFIWDLVFVDEGQDWPKNEIELLKRVFGVEKIVVADGIDQFVRNSIADWSIGLPADQIRPRRLSRCLRMKANLAVFVSDLAAVLGLMDWDLEPNAEANGGRVIIIEGDLSAQPKVYEDLKNEAIKLGNYPIDLLACVPPTFVKKTEAGSSSIVGQAIVEAGGKVWDASDFDVRQHYPTDREALRIVQYDSCRGLEGWTVFNYGFDDFWDYKCRQFLTMPVQAGVDVYETPDELARLFAARWVMMPLTRAMDTLVINVSSNQSFIKDRLREVHERRKDFVEWFNV